MFRNAAACGCGKGISRMIRTAFSFHLGFINEYQAGSSVKVQIQDIYLVSERHIHGDTTDYPHGHYTLHTGAHRIFVRNKVVVGLILLLIKFCKRRRKQIFPRSSEPL